jgi:hypothetical protein
VFGRRAAHLAGGVLGLIWLVACSGHGAPSVERWASAVCALTAAQPDVQQLMEAHRADPTMQAAATGIADGVAQAEQRTAAALADLERLGAPSGYERQHDAVVAFAREALDAQRTLKAALATATNTAAFDAALRQYDHAVATALAGQIAAATPPPALVPVLEHAGCATRTATAAPTTGRTSAGAAWRFGTGSTYDAGA